MYLFICFVCTGSCWCAQAFSSCNVRVSHCGGYSCCRAWALGTWASVVALCGPCRYGAWALLLWGMWESSQTRDQTHLPCIRRWILNQWTISEVPEKYIWILEKKQDWKCGFMLQNLEDLSYQRTKNTQQINRNFLTSWCLTMQKLGIKASFTPIYLQQREIF